MAELLELTLDLRAVLPQVLVLTLQLLVTLHHLHVRRPVLSQLFLETLALGFPSIRIN